MNKFLDFQMKPLIVAFLFVGSSLCEMVQSSMKPTGSNVAPQKQQTFAEARDGSFTATEWETVPYSAPFQSNFNYVKENLKASLDGFFAFKGSFGSQGQVQPSAFGLGGNFNLGFPSWMETGLSVIFTLVGLSILIQVFVLFFTI